MVRHRPRVSDTETAAPDVEGDTIAEVVSRTGFESGSQEYTPHTPLDVTLPGAALGFIVGAGIAVPQLLVGVGVATPQPPAYFARILVVTTTIGWMLGFLFTIDLID